MRGEDGLWHLFYTGTSRADGGKYQKLGHATSRDLHVWERVGDGMILDRDARYEEYSPGRWHDRAFRDPWVMRDPEVPGWLMFFTARNAAVGAAFGAGAIGFATSSDLYTWELQAPVFTGGFGELEVPQVFVWDDKWYCLFCTGERFWSQEALDTVGGPARTGSHYLVADHPRGPWTLAPGPMLDGDDPGKRYAARVVDHAGRKHLLGFMMTDPASDTFKGHIADPEALDLLPDGRLALASGH